MKLIRSAAVLAAFALTGCYHAVIETGRPAGSEVITQKWANSFIYGLVPPAMVNTASRCPNGVAKVETQHSFLNGLVAAITWGIYTPIQIDVTCASGGTASATTIEAGADKAAAMQQAADLAVKSGNAVLVRF